LPLLSVTTTGGVSAILGLVWDRGERETIACPLEITLAAFGEEDQRACLRVITLV